MRKAATRIGFVLGISLAMSATAAIEKFSKLEVVFLPNELRTLGGT